MRKRENRQFAIVSSRHAEPDTPPNPHIMQSFLLFDMVNSTSSPAGPASDDYVRLATLKRHRIYHDFNGSPRSSPPLSRLVNLEMIQTLH